MSVLAVVVIAVLVVGALTAAATAVRSVSRIWLRHWAEQGGRGSVVVATYLERPQRLILAAGTATALTVVAAGVAVGGAEPLGGWRDVARIVGTALVLLFLGQLLPRAVARRWAAPLVPFLVPPLRAVEVVLGPLTGAVRSLVLRRAPGTNEATVEESRDVLEDLLREGELEGVSAGDEAAIISGVVQFGDKTVGDVMRPRQDIFAVDASLPPEELASSVAQSGYSRVPVCDGSLDRMVGMVHVFDLIKASAGRPLTWRPLAFTTPETHCNDLLSRMLRGQRHLALVRGADGTVVGLVTLEDLLEELVGEITDEYDREEPEIVQVGERVYRTSGKTS
ncbi:MAG TPA: CBS domain-containing protein, partial [Gemmatimonadaceae bacterium]|nr:CBS domain-containing protein [Gemmatimonadaceae bacterium]